MSEEMTVGERYNAALRESDRLRENSKALLATPVPTMTRQEAIRAIQGAWSMRDSEFNCSEGEDDYSHREMKEALRALGCTPEEIGS